VEAHVLGARVVSAELRRADVCASVGADGAEVMSGPLELLLGARIVSLRRHGKQIAIVGEDGRTLVVHLGMTGQVLVNAAVVTHGHAVWRLERGGQQVEMTFRDPRRFGGLWTFPSFEAARERLWAGLGPDALELEGETLREACAGTVRAVKAVLLDQGVTAGVGNIYADESLFRAGIRPTRRGRLVKGDELERLAEAVRGVLAEAIEAGGSTLRDYADADGKRGRAQEGHAVYGRGGEACVRCGGTLRQGVVGQRTTVWCASCQK
jgi:formamidopyrimidine-DNA glycosylase